MPHRRFGRLDVLVSSAWPMPRSPHRALKVDEWERIVDVDVKGVLYGIAATLGVSEAQRSGHFVHVTPVADRRVVPTAAVYSAIWGAASHGAQRD